MSPARILAVDDDPNFLASLQRVLKRSRFEVETAENGRLGLRAAMRNPPDLVLVDISMPTLSGHEFLRRLRRLERRRHCGRLGGGPNRPVSEVPVIFLTALASPAQRVDGLDAGAVDYVTKPFDPDELRARIRSHLRRRQAEEQRRMAMEAEVSHLTSALSRMEEQDKREELTPPPAHRRIEPAGWLHDPALRAELESRLARNLRELFTSLELAAGKPKAEGVLI